MSHNHCPEPMTLLSFVDAALAPELLSRVEEHLQQCSKCAREVAELRQLIADIAAPLEPAALDLDEHVAEVMKRIELAPDSQSSDREPHWLARRLSWGAGALSATAAAWLLWLPSGSVEVPSIQDPDGTFSARGGAEEASLARDVGVRVYASEGTLRALEPGSVVGPDTALTAGFRNLAPAPVFLLLFAVDSEHVVHWIAPEFTQPGSDPAAVRVVPSVDEKLLGSSVVFDDLAPGPLRIITLVSPHPVHVSAVESLAPKDLTPSRLAIRFPRAVVREVPLQVRTR